MKTPSKIDLVRLLQENTDYHIKVIVGYDDAITGYFYDNENRIILIYEYDKIIDILIKRDGMTKEDATDFVEYKFCFPEPAPVIMYNL